MFGKFYSQIMAKRQSKIAQEPNSIQVCIIHINLIKTEVYSNVKREFCALSLSFFSLYCVRLPRMITFGAVPLMLMFLVSPQLHAFAFLFLFCLHWMNLLLTYYFHFFSSLLMVKHRHTHIYIENLLRARQTNQPTYFLCEIESCI